MEKDPLITHKEWKLMRILRALVDIRLHSGILYEKYLEGNPIEGYTSTQNIWNMYPNLEKYLVPIESETARCASIPAQALGYLQEFEGDREKHCKKHGKRYHHLAAS